MDTKKVKDWIKAQRTEGIKDFELRAKLLQKGYPSSMVADLLVQRKSPNILRLLPYFLVLIIVVAGIYFLIPVLSNALSGISGMTCTDQTCFINAANSCRTVKMQQVEAGSLFSYSEKGCVLTKTATKLNETEPYEMKQLLEGKSMQCSYAKGNFSENLVKTLSIGIEGCSGDLKDALDELIAAI